MDLRLSGKRVLVTGASQGIGAAMAEAFAREGCTLHLVARSQDKLSSVAARIAERHAVDIEVQAVDLTAPSAVQEVAARAVATDVLVNNAGAIPGGDLWALDASRWRDGWALKVFGTIDLTRAIYPLMQARGGGVILNNIGSGGENPDFDYIAGSTGNAALMAFTRSLGGRSLDHGIRVVGVNPGPVGTERLMSVLRGRLAPGQELEELLQKYPLNRPATVEEIADIFPFLASPRSGYTSGAIFTIDGGLTARRSISRIS
jgi:NAD(P)-dependent dehydrogenase (short-subunit alcohol dehydrogenase family)